MTVIDPSDMNSDMKRNASAGRKRALLFPRSMANNHFDKDPGAFGYFIT